MKNKLLIFCFLMATFAGCKVTWVPSYDASLEDQIVAGAKANDVLYLQMLDAPLADRKYNNFSSKYIDVKSEINSILLKNQARPKNSDIIASIDALNKLFDQFWDDHKKNNTISDADIKLDELQIAALWKVLLVEERGLKLAK